MRDSSGSASPTSPIPILQPLRSLEPLFSHVQPLNYLEFSEQPYTSLSLLCLLHVLFPSLGADTSPSPPTHPLFLFVWLIPSCLLGFHLGLPSSGNIPWYLPFTGSSLWLSDFLCPPNMPCFSLPSQLLLFIVIAQKVSSNLSNSLTSVNSENLLESQANESSHSNLALCSYR